MALAISRPYARQVNIASGLDLVAGLWLFLSGWAVAAVESLQWNNWIVGAIVAIIAAVRVSGAKTAAWLSWVNAILGVWVIVSPWVVSDTRLDATIWNNVITGLAIVILATWSALATNRGARETGVAATTTMRRDPTL